MFASSNEPGGTSYRSRLDRIKDIHLQVKLDHLKLKDLQKNKDEAEVKQEEIDYKSRDHALFIAFAPYKESKIRN